jgi:hypothetical protein
METKSERFISSLSGCPTLFSSLYISLPAMIHLTLLVEPEKGWEKNIYPINDVFFFHMFVCVRAKTTKEGKWKPLRNETEE